MNIKKKHLDRREWYDTSQIDYTCKRIDDGFFRGSAGLITFTGLEQPELVDGPDGHICIADNGYHWLELVPDDGHWALTSMFLPGGSLFQLYFDITLKNDTYPDGGAVFYDLFLDVVVGECAPTVLDREELEEAYKTSSITRKEYELALTECDRLLAYLEEHLEELKRRLPLYLKSFL